VLKDEVSHMFVGLWELRGGVGSALRGCVHTLGMDTQGTIPRVPYPGYPEVLVVVLRLGVLGFGGVVGNWRTSEVLLFMGGGVVRRVALPGILAAPDVQQLYSSWCQENTIFSVSTFALQNPSKQVLPRYGFFSLYSLSWGGAHAQSFGCDARRCN
jgi:hypothetical protein